VGGAGAPDEFRTPRPVAGWRVVLTAFCMALYAWGLGFYGLSMYVHHLGSEGGWSPTLLSAATTGYFLAGAAAIFAVERAAAQFGRRPVAIVGVLLLAAGVAALPRVSQVAALLAAYGAMALGWAATSGTAVSHVIGQWFEHRRGLALNLALTGASASGFLVVPAMVWCVGRFGPAQGLAVTVVAGAAALIVLIAFNLPEPSPRGSDRAVGGGGDGNVGGGDGNVGGGPAAGAGGAVGAGGAGGAAGVSDPLMRITALFAIGWLAQVAFLAQQLPLLVPKVGVAQATFAVALTTASSLAGRLALAAVIDRIDHRAATAGSLLLQALGMALLAASDEPGLVLLGCCLFGLSVGNLITLPAIFAQREFPPERYGAVVNRVWSVGQVLFAFGPLGAGALLAATGSAGLTLAACGAAQAVAALLCGWRGPVRA